MKKKIIALAGAAAVILSMNAALTVSASEPLDTATKELISESADKMIYNISGDDSENNADSFSYNIDNAYSVTVLCTNPILAYEEGGEFKDLYTNETHIILPFDDRDTEMTFDANGEFLYMSDGGNIAAMYPSDIDAVIAESLPGKNLDITYTYSDQYYATLVYIQDIDTGEEYIIPYMYISSIEEPMQTAVYTLDDFMAAMDATFEEVWIEDLESLELGDAMYGDGPRMRDATASALMSLSPITATQRSAAAATPVWLWILTGAGAVVLVGAFVYGACRIASNKRAVQ